MYLTPQSIVSDRNTSWSGTLRGTEHRQQRLVRSEWAPGGLDIREPLSGSPSSADQQYEAFPFHELIPKRAISGLALTPLEVAAASIAANARHRSARSRALIAETNSGAASQRRGRPAWTNPSETTGTQTDTLSHPADVSVVPTPITVPSLDRACEAEVRPLDVWHHALLHGLRSRVTRLDVVEACATPVNSKHVPPESGSDDSMRSAPQSLPTGFVIAHDEVHSRRIYNATDLTPQCAFYSDDVSATAMNVSEPRSASHSRVPSGGATQLSVPQSAPHSRIPSGGATQLSVPQSAPHSRIPSGGATHISVPQSAPHSRIPSGGATHLSVPQSAPHSRVPSGGATHLSVPQPASHSRIPSASMTSSHLLASQVVPPRPIREHSNPSAVFTEFDLRFTDKPFTTTARSEHGQWNDEPVPPVVAISTGAGTWISDDVDERQRDFVRGNPPSHAALTDRISSEAPRSVAAREQQDVIGITFESEPRSRANGQRAPARVFAVEDTREKQSVPVRPPTSPRRTEHREHHEERPDWSNLADRPSRVSRSPAPHVQAHHTALVTPPRARTVAPVPAAVNHVRNFYDLRDQLLASRELHRATRARVVSEVLRGESDLTTSAVHGS
jgi:hypothetical protein